MSVSQIASVHRLNTAVFILDFLQLEYICQQVSSGGCYTLKRSCEAGESVLLQELINGKVLLCHCPGIIYDKRERKLITDNN